MGLLSLLPAVNRLRAHRSPAQAASDGAEPSPYPEIGPASEATCIMGRNFAATEVEMELPWIEKVVGAL